MSFKSLILVFLALISYVVARYDEYRLIDWEYRVQGFTAEGQPCLNSCVNQRCIVDFDGHETDCVVTNTQVPKYFTRWGKPCLSNCDFFGWNYKWCIDSQRKNWDHCNAGDDHITIWEEKCIGKCTKQFSGYYWCKVKGGWQYCAPPREGADMITELPMFGEDDK